MLSQLIEMYDRSGKRRKVFPTPKSDVGDKTSHPFLRAFRHPTTAATHFLTKFTFMCGTLSSVHVHAIMLHI